MIHRNKIPEDIGSFLSYDPDTGDLTRKVSRGRWKAGEVAGCYHEGTDHVVVNFNYCLYKAHRVAWFLHYGEQPPETIDHWNGIGHDNRIVNLRGASESQNNWNKGRPITNTSGYKGVSWDKEKKKFEAYHKMYGKRYHLGYYDDPKEANSVVVAFREKHNGEFANHG